MSTWTVLHSSDFVAQLKALNAEFRQKYDHVIRSTSRAEIAKLDPRAAQYDSFMQAILDLKDGKSEPQKVLKYRAEGADGFPIFSQVCGRWRALYRVDESKRTCVGISIDEMSSAARYAEIIHRVVSRSPKSP